MTVMPPSTSTKPYIQDAASFPPVSLVGSRLDTNDGCRGTILYHGHLPPPENYTAASTAPSLSSTPVWLGVEWDDASRGKHSGDFKSIQVFQTRVPNAGSFVRLDAQKLRYAKTFLAAVADRYLTDESELDVIVDAIAKSSTLPGQDVQQYSTLVASVSSDVSDTAVKVEKSGIMRLGDSSQNVIVETVGWEKISRKQARLWNLREISLAAREVGWLGREVPGWIKALCPAVVDMDLSRNLFSRWCEVAYVCVELPALEMLRLNHNHFWWWSEAPSTPEQPGWGGRAVNFPPYFDPCASIPTGSFTNIKVLALNNTGIPWSEIETVVAPNFPNLQELHLGFNAMESFGPLQPSSTSLFSNLLLLNLESNLLSSWSDISTIASRLPSLTNLHLPNNKLFSIPASVTPLPTLKTLNVSQNAISDWLSLHAFNTHLPNLKELRFKGNPITATIEKNQARLDLLFEITARVGSITSVNGSPISPKDRRDAELWYLGKCAMEKLNSSIPFDATHPRYPALVLVHGESAAAPASAVSTALKDRLLELTLVSVMARNVPVASTSDPFLAQLPGGIPPNVEVCKKVTKKVPMTMTVRALKSLMARLVVPKGFGGECVFVEALVKGDDGWRNEDGMVRGDGGWLRPIVMGDELRDLGFYDLRSGDGVRMVLVD